MAFEFDASTAKADGEFDPTTATLVKPTGAIRKLADAALSIGKGVIAVPEAAVGLADLVTGGHAGKLAESAGVRFKDAKDVLTGWQSDDLKVKQQEFQQADGILSKTGVALSNPSLVANAVAESIPLMGAGGVGARALMAAAPKLGAVGAGALGEGIAGAGSAGEQIRQETSDGLLTGKQAALGAASGAATAAFGAAGGKLAKKLGIGDIDTMIAGGTTQVAAGATPKGVIRRMAEGALSEGALEELPQSLSEQALQNVALDRPVTQGLEDAAVMGALAGGVMGAGAGAISRQAQQPAPVPPPVVPPATPAMQIGNTPDPFISFADGTVARKSEVDSYINGLPPEQQPAARAKIMGLAPQPANQPAPVKPSEAMGLNPAAGPISAAAVQAVDSGVHEGIKLADANAADQAAYQQATAEQEKQAAAQDTIDKPITHGPIAEAAMSEDDKRAILFSNKTVADGGIQYEGTQDGDILNGLGKPYPTRFAAQRRARMEGKDWSIAPVFGGFVARRKDANDSRSSDVSSVLPTATGSGTNQPGTGVAPAVGTAGTDATAMDAGRAGDQPGREPVSPAGGVDATPVTKASNVQDPTPRADTPPAQARVETSPAVAGDAAATQGLPVATSPSVEGGGIAKIDDGAHTAATSPLNALPQPTEAQKQAGNYPKGHVNLNGLDLSIENPAGSERSGTDKAGKAWTNTLQHHYGYIKGTVGNDKDHVDLFVKPGTPLDYSGQVFVIDQVHPDTGRFDEHKIVVGAKNGMEARSIYQANYAKNWRGFKAMTEMPFDQFKTWVKDGTKNKPLSSEKMDTSFTSKLIPDMTDAELQQAKTHYPADHKRAPKIAKEINRRALVAKLKNSQPKGTPNGTQAAQAVETTQKGPQAPEPRPAAAGVTPVASDAAGPRIMALRAKARPVKDSSDVRLSSNHNLYVSFDDAVAAAREAVASGVRPVPFQIHDAIDIGIGETDRVIAALSAPVAKPVTPQVAPAKPVRNMQTANAKPEIVVDKAEMHPYRKPDGSVGYEAVPIQAEKPATAGPRVVINKLGADGLTDAERAAGKPSYADAPATKPVVSANTVFTEDAAAAARARLKAKLGRLSSGIDPEMMMDGITLAGYHMEKGARTFAAFAKAMVDDLGDAVKPYLKSWYSALRYDPRASGFTAGMSSAAMVDEFDLKDVAPSSDVTGLENSAKNDDTDSKDGPNATRQLDSTGKSSLEGAPANPVSGTAALGATGAGADAGGGSNPAGTGNADGAGLQVLGGMGGGAGVVPVPGGRGRGKRGSTGQRGVQGDGSIQPGFEFVDTSGGTGGLIPVNPAPNAAPIPAPAFADFTIEDDFALGEGGPKAKFKGNIEAVRLLNQLDAEARAATPSEQAVLARYVGWGGLAQAFDENNADWSREYAELKGLMSADDYADARVSTRYAHYTSRQVIQDGIYAALKHMGFNGGRALEGGAGVGNFMGLMPVDMRSASRFTAIEREPFSAKIAKHLYPQQNVQEADFTEFVGNDDYYDVAVGNPPFASDPQVDRSGRKHLSGLSLHNYFFAKEVDMLREGGILAQVVTNSFLDASTDTARTYIADKTKFLGAIRLPNNAFSKNAGTEVTTDLIFLQKRPESEWGGKQAKADAKQWLGVGEHRDAEGRTVPLNQYFIDHPVMMLGQFGGYGTMYRGGSAALIQKPGQDTGALLASAVARLPANIYTDRAITNTAAMQDALIKTLQNPSVHEGGYVEEDGKLFQRIKDLAGEARGKEITPLTQWTEKTKLGDAGFARIKALSAMRATLRGLLAAELSNDAKMVELRATLNTQYDAYAKEHGRINDPGTLRVFDDDPDFPLLASLEHNYTPAIGVAAAKSMGIKAVPSKATKGPIFTQRVIDARQPVAKVETPADALAVSMAERGKLDSSYIGELLGRDSDEVLQELSEGDKPLLFKDPATGEYALRDAYLSGNVRAKLVQAKQAGMFNNIKALEEVQPEDVGSHEIVARVGSPWVPESVYQDFAKMLFGDGTNASIKYVKATAGYSTYITAGSATANTNTWGIEAYPGTNILGALLNNKPVKVTWTDKEGTHTDVEAAERANAKAQDMRDKFQDWLFADGDRAELLGRAYNDTNNNYVTREFDGEWMTFPGKVPNSIVKFRRHQRNAIARIVQDRTALLDHVVGSGKTYTIVAAAMELRRTGLAKKPMIAVPNHLVKQWAADFYKLYPGANILTATKKDFEKSNRRKFLAKIATGDWDAVIIAHSSFGFIKPAPEFEHQFNNKQVAAIVATIREVEAGDGDKQQKKRTVKQLEGIKERLENRIKALRDKPMDALLDFGEIGVDQLFIDEAHTFKNLMFSTKMQNIAGLGDSKGSQRAYDMYVKANQIFSQNGRGQGLVFATGTPVSNSLAEMYHMMRYLMPTQMQEMGFESFDAWANTYASVEQVWMQKASGDGFKAQNRMSNFVNTPELLKVFDQVSDTVTMDDIKKAYAEENKGAEFPLPKLKGGKRSPVSLRKSAGQDAYMATVAARALALEQRKGPPKKGEDNILVIMSDARKAAMDIRLVDPTVNEREPGGRIDRSSQEIFARYQQFNAVKGTQIVFSDLGTPLKTAKKELTEYHALQARIEAGAGDELMRRATLGDEAAQEKIDDAEDAQEELDAKGRDWLGAMQAAERGFSVYDDLKAALVEKGVPEQEVAFIHDYNTDEQKAGLFRKMNSGQIRVLLGSTPKLGAGTNVQERLVALHHLDVPWKPSDVEQREGRIIRQGNKLAPVDGLPGGIPGFEVEVLAYVTQDTLDMRMWQVQETKLKMINQLRTRKIGREVENAFEDLELSAGEMQAAATGNMDLLREIQIKGELKKLEQRKRSFDAQKSDLQNRKKSVAQKLASLPAKIESSKPMAEASDQYKAELAAQANAFKATIDGKEYTSAKEAGAVLLGMIDAHVYMQRQEDGKYGGRQLSEAEVQLEPKQDPAAADYNPWVKRPVPLAMEFNGVDFKSRDKLQEAFSDARGDREPIAWKVAGKTMNRRTVIQGAIRNAVSAAISDESVEPIGSLGPFDVSVEGQSVRSEKVIDVALSYRGQTISNARGMGVLDESTVSNALHVAISMAENLASSARQQHEYEKRQLAQALKEQAELDSTPAAGEWPEQGKLEEMRQKHKEVLQRLSGVGVKQTLDGETMYGAMGAPNEGIRDDADVVFSTRDSAPEQQLPLQQIERLVKSALRGVKNAPAVRVVASPESIGLRSPVDTVPSGVVLSNGDIYVFQSGVGSALDVDLVVFHEVFHKGLQNAMPRADYVAAMQDIARIDAKVRQYASEWSATNAGKDQLKELGKKYSGKDLADQYEALATEEGLAKIAEDLKARREMGSKDMRVRRLVAWLAKVADKIGMTRLADRLRAMSYNDAEKFVIATIGRADGSTGGSVKFSSKDASKTDQTDTPAFRKWFGDSKVADAAGEPLVVYHGTFRDIKSFESTAEARDPHDWRKLGFWFTDDTKIANNYADGAPGWGGDTKDGGNVMPVYLSLKNPKSMTYSDLLGVTAKQADRLRAKAIQDGFDGLRIGRHGGKDGYDYVAFQSEQIKSATGNNGDFDATNPDIRFRAADTLNAAANNATVNKVVDKLNEHFNHAGTLSFWDKTVGSPYHLAQRSPAFNKVFKAVQGFINGVSFYANEAADMAPTLLPKLENWRDIGKSPISTEDNKAIQAPIFQGTLSWARDESGKAVRIDALEAAAESLTVDQKAQRLLRGDHISEGVMKMWRGLPVDQYESIIEGKYQSDMLKAGVVFTDAELTSLFSLTPAQIKLYREFRSATDKSLDNMGKAEMLRFGGKDVVQISDDVLNAASITEAAERLRDHLMMAASFDPDRNDVLLDAANGMMERADKVTKLKAEGYAPLSRFGQYSVDVVVDGERQYFSLFETKHEANVMAAKMKMMYGAGNVQQGTMSQLEFQLLQGITPESLELFGNMLGLDSTGNEASDKAFQTYLRLTKNNRSAMKRMIHRKGIAGYHEDAGRVLAAFVYSNARQTAAALHMGEITQAVNDIPQGEGQLKDAAVRLRDYVQNPKEEAQAMRGLLFAQYLGGSVASAFVNFTQPFTVSFPYLSQFGGAKRAAGALMQAMKDQKSGQYEPALAKALLKADEEGATQPQAVHELMAQSRGAGTLKPGDGTRMGDATALGGNALAKLSLGWGKLFGLAEQINRRSTYIAAFRMAVENKVADPAAFAKKAVDETQFINNKGNKSRFARGAIGATLMTFKSYSINYLELLHRMATQNGPEGKKAAALMLGMLFLMAGAGGMPGADDLDDVIDFFAQRLGYNFASAKARQEFLESLFGRSGALFVERGLTGLPGSPIDVSGRMSMGNMIPGTGLLLKKRDHTRDATEILGAMGDMAQRAFKAGDHLLDGNVGKAILTAAPKAVSNAAKGFDMAGSGSYNDDKGYKVQDVTLGEAAFKAIGFQPASVSRVQESNYLNQRAKDFYALHAADIRARWAQGIYENDQAQVQAARNMITSWNEQNPEQRMQANIPAIMRKVHEMKKTKEQRIADTAPKAMRAQMRRDIAERAQ